MPLIDITVPKGAQIQGRGRNGWFQVADVNVHHFTTDGSSCAVNFYSKQHGNMPPMVVDGNKAEITQLFQNILAALKGEEQ